MLRSPTCRLVARTLSQRWVVATGTTESLSSCLTRIASTKPNVRGFADFSMDKLKELRSISGAPIVDCKKALSETKGDINAAMDWLRQHGAAKASQKVSGREAEEGLVACTVADDGKSASLVKVSSETDFAGKSAAFVDFVTHVADATLSSEYVGKIDPELVLTLQSESKTVKTALDEAIVAIRENLGISSAIKLTTQDGLLVSYVHGKVVGSKDAGSSAAIVEISGKDVDFDTMRQAGKKLAMHIVAAKPVYLNPQSVPSDVLEKERAILQSQIAESNKPPNVQEKIVNGRLKKFYEEICLTEQEHMVEEGNPKVSSALEHLGLDVVRFERVSI